MTTLTLTTEQEAAVRLMMRERIGIVTGGPGTGKTTVLRTAVQRLTDKRADYLLLAPTGKAARRITEVTSVPAYTIHRALANPDIVFPHMTFIDEASMVDTALLARLMLELPAHAHLILIGDADQLPSIGPGRVFADLIATGTVPTVRLTAVHRSKADSWVCANAPNILKGKDLDLSERPDFKFIEAKSEEGALDAVLAVMKECGFDSNKTQLLTPMHGRTLGTKNLNQELQKARLALDHSDRIGAVSQDVDFYLGDPVMHTVNDYQRLVFNGEIGRISSAGKNGVFTVTYDRPVLYTLQDAESYLRLAYAITVHKSQGSEWDTIVLVCHDDHHSMWSRQLLYTAVTRAKSKVYLVGTKSAIRTALLSDDPQNRITTLKERILA